MILRNIIGELNSFQLGSESVEITLNLLDINNIYRPESEACGRPITVTQNGLKLKCDLTKTNRGQPE